MLYYTSLLFAGPLLHAYAVGCTAIHVCFTMLLPLSVLVHAKYYDTFLAKSVVANVDWCLAAALPVYGIISWPQIPKSYPVSAVHMVATGVFVLCLCMNIVLYPFYIYKQHSEHAFRCHALLHVNMALGAHAYLIAWDTVSTLCTR